MEPVLPDYKGGCTANVVPEVIKHLMGQETADWLPAPVKQAKQVVLLVVDGLGWEQLQARAAMAPTLSAFEGGPITTVAPSTTATALTSIVTGRTPSATGMVGHRVLENGKILNILKWQTEDGADARVSIPPLQYQTQPAFAGNEVPAVTRREFMDTGFTQAHLDGAKYVGYSATSSLPVEVWRLVSQGESFVYAYYQFLDTIAHAHGMGEHFDAELYTVDRLVRDLLAGMPPGTALLVTSDHGQVQVGGRLLRIDEDIAAKCYKFSGEGRFKWLHTKGGISTEDLLQTCKERYGDMAWVKSRDEVIDEGWFGGPLSEKFQKRLGDVALVASADVAFVSPDDSAEQVLQCRHGSLTSAEMMVPLVARLS